MMDRAELDRRIASVTKRGKHKPWHIDTFVDAVLETRSDGCLVECGAFEGVSTAKWSHLADMLGKRLVVFDSFAGLPANNEAHEVSIGGKPIKPGKFSQGRYCAPIDTVKQTVERYGIPEVVTYVEGWFTDTLPDFDEPVAAAYLDVDLASSTTTCLGNLWPLVMSGGVVVSQDGAFPVTVQAMRDWLKVADPAPSRVDGLGTSKMVRLDKP